MLVQLEGILGTEELGALRARLVDGAFTDGRESAGSRARLVKRNLQVAAGSPLATELGETVLRSLSRSPLFVAAALPKRISQPMFNRYEPGMEYGDHIDNGVMGMPPQLRADIAGTLFLTEPGDYDGGELVVRDSYGWHSVKLKAGDLALYPASSVHRVQPVGRGVRLAAVIWVQSMVRETERRQLLFDMKMVIQRLGASQPGNPDVGNLMACYHNLIRMWADV